MIEGKLGTAISSVFQDNEKIAAKRNSVSQDERTASGIGKPKNLPSLEVFKPENIGNNNIKNDSLKFKSEMNEKSSNIAKPSDTQSKSASIDIER